MTYHQELKEIRTNQGIESAVMAHCLMMTHRQYLAIESGRTKSIPGWAVSLLLSEAYGMVGDKGRLDDARRDLGIS